MTIEQNTLYCENHPNVETNLRCNRCEKPICTKCAVHTPTGYRCSECVRNQQKSFDTAQWFDYILAFGIAIILAYIGSQLTSRIGFFTIFLAPIAGMIIAEAVRFAVRRRRSKILFQLSAVGVALGGLLPVIIGLTAGMALGLTFGLNVLLHYLWPLVYTVLVTSTVYYRLAGIRT